VREQELLGQGLHPPCILLCQTVLVRFAPYERGTGALSWSTAGIAGAIQVSGTAPPSGKTQEGRLLLSLNK